MFLRRNLWRSGLRSEAQLRELFRRGLSSASPSLPPFDHSPRPYKGMLADEVLEKRKKFLGPSLSYYYQKPVISCPDLSALNIVEGKMQYLYDETGKRYLDAFAGIVTKLKTILTMVLLEMSQALLQKLFRIQFNTFGGNPVCSAGGLAVLKVLDKEKRQAHCADVVIGDVRGRGLMLGVELVSDKDKTPAKAETAVLFEKLKGMILAY
ncbi:hypothetical protein GW17_00041954 [Ensete ventricosum]|nr:hypothetical protein GW17_00041954 [Ensete ventricosum]